MKILYGFIVIDVDDQRFERKTYHSTRMIRGKDRNTLQKSSTYLREKFLLHLYVYELESVLLIRSPDIFCIYPLYMENLRRSTSLRALNHNKREVLPNNIDVLVQASLTERNKKLSTWLVCYTEKKKRFSDSVLLSFSTVLLTFLLFKRFLWNGTGNYWLSVDIAPCLLV